MTTYRKIKGRKRATPMRGGLATQKSYERGDWTRDADRHLTSDKPALPENGNLFGSEKLGNFGGTQGGKPIVKDKKSKKGESGFGL